MAMKCEKCDKILSNEEALQQHTAAKHPETAKKPFLSQQQKKTIRNLGIAIIILGLIIWGLYALLTREPTETKELQINISQTDMLKIPYGPVHWHPHLTIKIDNRTVPIPAGIGITIGKTTDKDVGMEAGMAPTHTHSADGIIHIENTNAQAKPETLFLGYFFYIWEKEFSKECIFDYCTTNGTLKMFVNGEESAAFENYLMQDGDEIVIEYTSNTGAAERAENPTNLS